MRYARFIAPAMMPLVIYFIAAFTSLEVNPLEWTEKGRFVFSVLSIVLTWVCAASDRWGE